MKIENFSADYNESMYPEPMAEGPGIRAGRSGKRKGGYISFRVVLSGDEDMKTFQAFAQKVQGMIK